MKSESSKWGAAGVALVGVVIGVALVSAGTTAVHWSGSLKFCSTFCHSMDEAYAAYKKGLHGTTRIGSEITCVDCHLKYESHRGLSQSQVVGLLMHKAESGFTSLWGEIRGTLKTKEMQIEKRPEMAETVTNWMKSTDYLSCRGCHNPQAMATAEQNPKANAMVSMMHKSMDESKQADCLACHPAAGHKYE